MQALALKKMVEYQDGSIVSKEIIKKETGTGLYLLLTKARD